MNTETCLHCAHADFEATKGSEMQGFAKCLKARNFIERAMYHPRSDRCDKGKFEKAVKRDGWDGND
jgi:hypothetical protein|nr:MAG TPA: hypothetical protein [Caudoviricetes sp.]